VINRRSFFGLLPALTAIGLVKDAKAEEPHYQPPKAEHAHEWVDTKYVTVWDEGGMVRKGPLMQVCKGCGALRFDKVGLLQVAYDAGFGGSASVDTDIEVTGSREALEAKGVKVAK
jgi:hypothetical protein